MSVRSKEQLAVMLKLINVNNLSLTRKNVSVRHKVWQVIMKKLNEMQGAKKDVDGWKRSYYTWRLNAGTNHLKEMQKIIRDVPDDDYFFIQVTDDEEVSENDDEDEVKYNSMEEEKQKIRLHELVSKHREILQSTADDEPLKARIWLNITEELNGICGGLKLSPSAWKKRVDWNKYTVRKGRKSTKTKLQEERTEPTADDSNRGFVESIKNVEFEVIENSNDVNEQDYDIVDELFIEEDGVQNASNDHDRQQMEEQQDNSMYSSDLNDDLDALLHDSEEYGDNLNEDLEYKPRVKRIKPSPMVKSFKYTNRIANAVEKLGDDVNDIKELLQKTANSLVSIENSLQQQCRKQDETNTLLRRNGQLLRLLVEYKSGRRMKQ